MRAVFLKQSSVLLLSASLLAACGGGGGDSPAGRSGEPATRELTFAYPADGQTEIATPAPVVLRFTDRVDASAVENDVTLTRVDTGDTVAFTATPVGTDGRTLLLQPGRDLAAHTEYRVDLQTLQLDNGVDNLTFTTRAAQRGPRSETITSEQFALNRRYPNGGTQEPVMDFSTFRYQFSQPIDPATATYGETGNVRIVDSEGDLVEARLLVDGPYMTVDPVPDYLTPGEEYRLYLEDGLTSTYGLPLDGENIRFTPKDSSPDGEPAILVQKVTVPGDAGTGDGTSRLTGKPINQVPVNSTLLGNDSATQSEGNVAAELASSVVYPFVTPIRVPRNTLLTGSNIDVMIGGAVPAGIRSGKVKMHFLSDATGYLTSNPYSTRDDALRQIRLFMDVAIATENPEANGGFTQDLLHIELVGMAEVDTDAGVLNLDAVSMVEPDVLGQEFAHGLLSFQLQSYPDQTSAPPGSVDDAAPTLQSWTFGEDGATGLDKTAMIKPTDPIILNFSEPLDRDTVTGKVHLYKNEGGTQTEMDTTVTVDGGAIVIRPAQPLEHPTETGPSLEYQVSIDAGITDLSGEPWVESFDETFGFGPVVETRQPYGISGFGANSSFSPDGGPEPTLEKSAYVMGLYPGYPCALDENSLDLANDQVGRCRGGIHPHDVPAGYEDYTLPSDDIIPLPAMPANRPIIVVTSTPLDPETIILGRTFQVNEVAVDGTRGDSVGGSLDISGNTLKFTPDSPWNDGTLYSYRLVSNGDMESSDAQCNSSLPDLTLCDLKGLPLNTQLLPESQVLYEPRSSFDKIVTASRTWIYEDKSPSMMGGGPDLVQYFQGAPQTDTVLQLLRLSNSTDENKNLILEKTADIGSVPYIGASSAPSETYGYSVEETTNLDLNQQDSFTTELTDEHGIPLDPGGVRPQPNSAKVLSSILSTQSLGEGQQLFNDEDLIFPDSGYDGYIGASVGCAYEDFQPWEEQAPGCETNYLAGGYGTFVFGAGAQCFQGRPKECPQDKFTYLNGVLFAEVTDHFDSDNNGIVTHIYPGQITTTSFELFLKTISLRTQDYSGGSGPQLMRMRYRDDGGLISAYISEGEQGPELSASVDLYLDAFRLTANFLAQNIAERISHNQHSYPVSMNLSGPIRFLEDGRMIIEQFNEDPITVKVRGNVPSNFLNLVIPEKGSYLRYISEPIK